MLGVIVSSIRALDSTHAKPLSNVQLERHASALTEEHALFWLEKSNLPVKSGFTTRQSCYGIVHRQIILSVLNARKRIYLYKYPCVHFHVPAFAPPRRSPYVINPSLTKIYSTLFVTQPLYVQSHKHGEDMREQICVPSQEV